MIVMLNSIIHSDFEDDFPLIEMNEGPSLIGLSQDREVVIKEQDKAYQMSLEMDMKKTGDLERKSQT